MPIFFRDMSDKQEKEFKKTREKRLNKLGIKVTKKKKHVSGEESWNLDKSGYKRKEGLFKKKYKPVKYGGAGKATKKKKSSFWSDSFGHLGKKKRKTKKKKGFFSSLRSL
jgi:hypothetical protein